MSARSYRCRPWLLVALFTAMGILLWIVARPMAKLSVVPIPVEPPSQLCNPYPNSMLDEANLGRPYEWYSAFSSSSLASLGQSLAIALPYHAVARAVVHQMARCTAMQGTFCGCRLSPSGE